MKMGNMNMGKLLASTAMAAVLGLGLSTLPATFAVADTSTATGSTASAPIVGQPEELIGKTVVDEQGDTVGEIDSVLIDKDGQVRYVIVGVGGFLGIGEQDVALTWDEMRLAEGGEQVIAPVTKESLSQLPAHRYPDAARSGKVYPLDEDLAANPYLNAEGKAAANAPDEAEGDATVTAGAGAVDSETLVGKAIVNAAGDKIGEVESVVIDKDGSVAYVIAGVGGFLGVGERDVALDWDDLTITGQGDRVTADMTKEQLEAMPEYKRPENVSGAVYSYDEAVRDNQFLAEGGVAQTTDIAPAAGTEQTDIDNETTVTAAGLRASEVVGADVKNATGDNIGEISEVILQQDGSVNGVIVDVGGFLGVGERPVLVNWKDLQFAGIEGDVAVTTTLNKDQLATFPEFKASR